MEHYLTLSIITQFPRSGEVDEGNTFVKPVEVAEQYDVFFSLDRPTQHALYVMYSPIRLGPTVGQRTEGC